MFQKPAGFIESPNYKGQYPNNVDCTWLISLPKKRVGLTFTDFSTQRGYDQLKAYQHPGSPKRLLDYSGVIVLSGPIISEDYMYLRFISNGQNDRAYHGFRAYYEIYNKVLT